MAEHVRQSALRNPLTVILGARAHVMTLRELSRHGGELSAPTLVRLTGLAKASVRKALLTLEGMAVVESVGVGRAILYRAARAHPLALPIAALFEAEADRFDALANAIADLAMRTEGVVAIWLYGSVARGEDRPRSDVDVAVIASSDAGKAESAMRDALRAVEDEFVFSASVVALDTNDVRRLATARDPWWESLAREAYVIHGDRPEALARALNQKAQPRRKRSP